MRGTSLLGSGRILTLLIPGVLLACRAAATETPPDSSGGLDSGVDASLEVGVDDPGRDGSVTCDAAEPPQEGLLYGRVRSERLGPSCAASSDGFPGSCPDGMGCVGFGHGDAGLVCVR